MLQQLIITLLASIVIMPTLKGEKPTIGQYDHKTITILQAMNGECYLSQGGAQFIDYIVGNNNLYNKKVLDFGSGLCGPAMHLAKKYGAQVTGIEVDPLLIALAQQSIEENNLESSITLHHNTCATTIPFADESFDVIFSKEVIVHVKNKQALFKEFFRVLKPEGILIIVDWFKQIGAHSKELNETLELDALTFHYCTSEEYGNFLINAGFTIEKKEETSPFHLEFIRKEYQELHAHKGRRIKEFLGEAILTECFQNWQAHTAILETQEIQTYLFKAKKNV